MLNSSYDVKTAATHNFAFNIDTSGLMALGEPQSNHMETQISDPFQDEEISVSILKIGESFDFTSYYNISLIIQK